MVYEFIAARNAWEISYSEIQFFNSEMETKHTIANEGQLYHVGNFIIHLLKARAAAKAAWVVVVAVTPAGLDNLELFYFENEFQSSTLQNLCTVLLFFEGSAIRVYSQYYWRGLLGPTESVQ